MSGTAWISCSKSKLKDQNQKDKGWIFPFLHLIMVINITSTERNLWFLKEAVSNYMWLLFHKYLPSVLQITPKAYFVNKSSYQIVKFQLLKENLIIATYFLFEYWGKKNKGNLAQVFYRQFSLFQLFEWTFLPFFFFLTMTNTTATLVQSWILHCG